MKYLFLVVLFFIIFWYYKKRKVRTQEKKRLELQLKACFNCGIYVAQGEAIKITSENKEILFCSERCLKEYLKRNKVCS